MSRLASKLRIGEKIGFGFGFVVLLFLGVIWQYHILLKQSLADYHQLQEVYGAKKNHALAIESSLLEARRSEKDFLLQKDESFITSVKQHVDQVLTNAEQLGSIDATAIQTAKQIARLTQTYQLRFQAIVEAWQNKGLDHNSGLQGAFRDTVHELEAMASQLKVDNLYLQYLQIRRAEKDLILQRMEKDRSNVLLQVDEFKKMIATSALDHTTKERYLEEIITYLETLQVYMDTILANQEIDADKESFQEAAQRIESLLDKQYVPDLERNILQLRRREKDYLLRDDKQYVDMVLQELVRIHAQVNESNISVENKTQFMILLENYQRNFLALVEQNVHIDQLTDEMHTAVAEIDRLVKENVDSANQMMNQMAANISASSRSNAQVMLWIVAVATLLGIFFAMSITLRIARPLRQMADLLDRLAYEEPAERMPFVSGGRDEVNAMAESVNTIVDHKARFIAWWKTSMQEADACQKLEDVLIAKLDETSPKERQNAEKELWKAILAKRSLVADQYQEISRLNSGIIDKADRMLADKPPAKAEFALNTIRNAANSIQNILAMASIQEGSKQKTEE